MLDIRLSHPASGSLSPAEVVKLLESEFGHVIVDQQRGIRWVSEQMLDARRRGATADADRLGEVLGGALEVIATDDVHSDDEFLKLLLVPGEYPLVRFFSDDHQRRSATLLQRCQTALKTVPPAAGAGSTIGG